MCTILEMSKVVINAYPNIFEAKECSESQIHISPNPFIHYVSPLS